MKFVRDDLLPDGNTWRSVRAAFLRRRQWLFGSTLAIIAITATAYSVAPRRYVAAGSVWLNSAAAGTPAAANDGTRARNTELRILTSGDIAGQVVDALGLARVRGFGLTEGADDGAAVGRSRAIRTVIAGLQAVPQGTTYAATVRYADADRKRAARIVNRTLERYVATRRGVPVPASERRDLRKKLDRAHDRVVRSEAALSAASADPAASSVKAPPPRSEPPAEARRDVAGLRAAERERARLARLSWIARTSGPAVKLASEEARLTAERAALVQRLGSIHPDVVAIDARLAEVGRDRRREDAEIATLKEQVRAAGERVEQLRAGHPQADAPARPAQAASEQRTPPSGKRLERIRKEVETARKRYAALVEKQQQADAADRAAQRGAYIIARATVPVTPDTPHGWIYVLAGLAAALIAAVVIAFGDDIIARGFRSRSHAERRLGIPVIGMVPDLNRMPGDAKASGVDPADYLFVDSRSPFTAAFRSIHTGLRLGTAANSPRSIAVSSALPDEGKTTVSICLARSAALAGLRVLLIDCDVRHPAASRALAAHVSTGLIEVLRGDAQLKDALLRDTPSGAWILGHTNDGGDGADDLIASPAMADLLETLPHEFDLVVLDTPPALALDEARTVSAMADCVLLVARWHKTPVEATRLALDQLTRAGANVIAAALTLVGR